MPSNFEQLIFEIIATDKNASAAFDRFRQKVDQTSRSVDESSAKLDKNSRSLDSVGKSAGNALPGLSGLAGSGGMGAAIAAGVVLSPVIATLSVGLAGFGAAAYGVIKPIENAAQKTGGLQKNMHLLNAEQKTVAQGLLGLGAQYHQFEHQLQPEVFKVFNAGLHLAGGLLHDVEPVAAATGKALGGLVGQIDQEFRSNNWQNFFGFMAKTAGPDMKLLGNAFVSLTGDLPPLLEALQPVATTLLTVVNYGGQAIRMAELASSNFQDLGKSGQKSAGGFNAFTTGLKAAIPGMQTADRFGKELGQGLDILYGNSGPASKGLKETGAQALASAGHIQTLKQAVTALTTAETKSLDTQLAYSNSLVTSANDAVALRTALKASGGQIGLHTAAERASFSAANTYIGDLEQTAKQSWASGHGTDGAIKAIRDGLPTLESAKTHSKLYWQEVQTLVSWLHKLEEQKKIHEVVSMTGSGTWAMGKSSQFLHGLNSKSGFATGGRVPGYGGGDRNIIAVEGGETIFPKHLTPAIAPIAKAYGLPGFAVGGIVPSYGGSVKGMVPWSAGDRLTTIAAMIGAFVTEGRQMQASASGGLGGVAPASGSALAAQRYAASLLGLYGWGQSQMGSLIPLWNQESGWNAWAVNPSSGAYGIPQSLGHGHPYALGDYKNQVIWGLNYIAGRYGSPAGAEAHELSAGWYDRGGYLPPGLSVAYNGTGRPEPVGGGGIVIQNLSINLPHGSDREQGRRIVDAIRTYEKGSGTSWRS